MPHLTILRRKHIKTIAEVYMDHIPDSERKAIDTRTDAIFKLRTYNGQMECSEVLHHFEQQRKSKVSVS